MVASYLAGAIVALSALANASPIEQGHHPHPTSYQTSKTHPANGGQTPFKFPLANGFPDIKIPSAQLTNIEKQAHGTLPNGKLPTTLADGDATTLQVIATNELFEVAFFSSLIQNITGNLEGFASSTPEVSVQALVANLEAIRAQEELHAIGANAILTSAGHDAIQPCEYVFPSSTLTEAIRFASTFTDVVLGTLQDAQAGFAANGDTELIPLVGSIIGQEGEQDGYYRDLLSLVPSQLPFLTRSAGPFAYSVLNQVVLVNGSCPSASQIQVPIFEPLTLNTANVAAKDQTLSFSFINKQGANTNGFSLVYINQQNTPVVVKPTNVQTKGKKTTFQASFPYTANLMNGLTIAAVTNSAGPFASVPDVAGATLFGPALIEIL